MPSTDWRQSSVVDQHRFAANLDKDPEQTFHFDAVPDPKSEPKFFTHVGKSEKFLLLLFTTVPVHIVLYFSSGSRCQNFQYFDQYFL
jgi:hypothetical protein